MNAERTPRIAERLLALLADQANLADDQTTVSLVEIESLFDVLLLIGSTCRPAIGIATIYQCIGYFRISKSIVSRGPLGRSQF